MAKLPSLVTNATTGEALNYYSNISSIQNVIFKQEFEVTRNDNFTWSLTTRLYIKLSASYTSGGQSFEGFWQRIGNEYFKLQQEVQIIAGNGIYIGGNKVTNNAHNYYKILENTKTFNCNNTGRYAIRLDCGWIYNTSTYYGDGYTLIYVTFPPFSGAYYKINNGWKSSMPWIKVNGEWKRAKQFVKVNNQWKECKDSWIWNPES